MPKVLLRCLRFSQLCHMRTREVRAKMVAERHLCAGVLHRPCDSKATW